jgi:hypothetical protein
VTLSAEDRLDILELLSRADNAASLRDGAAYVALFTKDGVLDGEKGEHRGHAALRAAVDTVWGSEGPASVHLTLNAVIEPVEGQPDRATADSTLLIILPGPPPTLRTLARIVQDIERDGTGWRIARRSVMSP